MEDVTKCHGDTRNDADCDVFQRDPGNGACLQCLYSTEDEPAYGAVIVLFDGSFLANVPGCVALWNSDRTPTGCGARMQALDQCQQESCSACDSYDARVACERQSNTTSCDNYLRDAACWQRPNYATCTNQATFREYFLTMAEMFCGSGVGGGGPLDAGAPQDGPAEAGMKDSALLDHFVDAIGATD